MRRIPNLLSKRHPNLWLTRTLTEVCQSLTWRSISMSRSYLWRMTTSKKRKSLKIRWYWSMMMSRRLRRIVLLRRSAWSMKIPRLLIKDQSHRLWNWARSKVANRAQLSLFSRYNEAKNSNSPLILLQSLEKSSQWKRREEDQGNQRLLQNRLLKKRKAGKRGNTPREQWRQNELQNAKLAQLCKESLKYHLLSSKR